MMYEREGKTQSPLETRFLEDCVTVGLQVEPQYAVGKIHADFAIPDKRVVIECDSDMYHSSEEAIMEDFNRNRIYTDAGWSVIRISGKDVYRAGELIAEQIKMIVQQGLLAPGKSIYIRADKGVDGRWEVHFYGNCI